MTVSWGRGWLCGGGKLVLAQTWGRGWLCGGGKLVLAQTAHGEGGGWRGLVAPCICHLGGAGYKVLP